MVKKKNKKNIAIFSIFMIGILLVMMFAQQLTTFTTSGITFDDGSQAWVTTVFMNTQDVTPARVVFDRNTLENTAGGELTVPDSEIVEISFDDKKCVYSVTEDIVIGNNGIFKILNPKADIDVKVQTLVDPSTHIMDEAFTGQQQLLNTKDGGQITATISNVDTGNFCYIGDDMRILKFGDSYEIFDGNKLGRCTSLSITDTLICLLNGGIQGARDDLFYQEMKNPQFSGTFLIAEPISNNAKINVQLTADKEYFRAEPKAVLNAVGDPKIQSFNCPDLSSGRQGSLIVPVKNVGDRADIQVQVFGENIVVSPETQSKNIFTNEQKSYPFTILPADVASTQSYTFTIVASSTTQLGAGNTDEKTCRGSIEPSTMLPPDLEYCGNSNCGEYETPVNCPSDCQRTVCNIANLEELDEDTGACVCVTGSVRNADGACVKSLSQDIIIAGIVLAIFVVFAIIIYTVMGKRGKKRR